MSFTVNPHYWTRPIMALFFKAWPSHVVIMVWLMARCWSWNLKNVPQRLLACWGTSVMYCIYLEVVNNSDKVTGYSLVIKTPTAYSRTQGSDGQKGNCHREECVLFSLHCPFHSDDRFRAQCCFSISICMEMSASFKDNLCHPGLLPLHQMHSISNITC